MDNKTILRDSQSYQNVKDKHCFKFFKLLFCLYNLSLLLCGCTILGLGSWTLSERWYYIHLVDDTTYQNTSLLLMLTGLVAVLTGILGYTGVITNNKTLLALYTILVVIVFVFEAVLGLMSYLLQDRLREDLGDFLVFEKYKHDHLVRASVDQVQIQFRCCGVSSYLDWRNTSWSRETPGLKVPDSCCKTPAVGCGVRDHPSNIQYTGCVHRLERDLYQDLEWVKVTSLAVSLLQVCGVLVTSCLLTSWPRTLRGNRKRKPVMIKGYWRSN